MIITPSVFECQKFCQNTDGCSFFLFDELNHVCEAKFGSGLENMVSSEGLLYGPRMCTKKTSKFIVP